MCRLGGLHCVVQCGHRGNCNFDVIGLRHTFCQTLAVHHEINWLYI